MNWGVLFGMASKAANTPCRLIGLLGAYLVVATAEGSGMCVDVLCGHEDVVRPAGVLMVLFWLYRETWIYLKTEQLFPASQKEVLAVSKRVQTITERQTRLADTIGEAHWETDASGRMIFSNYANSRLYGTTAREIVRSGTAPYIHKNDLQNVYRIYKQATEGQMGFSVEFDVVDRGNYVRSLRVYAWPLFEEDGTFMGHYGSAETTEDLFDGNN